MKNNTKIRLHLSKQLFESLTKQVIAEAKGKKNFGAGMEEVKKPKKKDKDMKSEALNVSKNATPSMVHNIGDLKRKLYDLSRQVTLMKGLDSAEIGLIIKLLDDVMTKIPAKSLAAPLKTATRAFDAATSGGGAEKKGVKEVEEMETRVAEDSAGLKEDETSLVNPVSWPTQFKDVTQWFGALLGSGMIGAVFYGVMNDLKKGKIGKKEAAMKLADELEKTAAKATDEPAPKG